MGSRVRVPPRSPISVLRPAGCVFLDRKLSWLLGLMHTLCTLSIQKFFYRMLSHVYASGMSHSSPRTERSAESLPLIIPHSHSSHPTGPRSSRPYCMALLGSETLRHVRVPEIPAPRFNSFPKKYVPLEEAVAVAAVNLAGRDCTYKHQNCPIGGRRGFD